MAQPVFTDLPEGHFLFSSESVNEGHPDKLCDQVSSDPSLGVKNISSRIIIARSKWYMGYPIDKLKWL